MVLFQSDFHVAGVHVCIQCRIQGRWPGGTESKTEFALVLFAGLMIFNFFAECINRSPALILSNVNYVKKVVFPGNPAVRSFGLGLFICLSAWLCGSSSI